MRILVVEDDQFKREQVMEFVRNLLPSALLVERRSLQGGLRELIKQQYDVIILDMSLPNYDISSDEPDGGLPLSFGGREILQQMDRRKILVPVIIFTGFDVFGQGLEEISLHDLVQDLKSNHKTNYFGTVYYNATADTWKKDLSKLLKNIPKESTNGQDSRR